MIYKSKKETRHCEPKFKFWRSNPAYKYNIFGIFLNFIFLDCRVGFQPPRNDFYARSKYLAVFLTILFLSFNARAELNRPLTTDSRIRTLVFNENEVFKLNTRYGYQANIEFGKEEEITTISIGDPIPFNIIPDTNRIFIKAKQNGMKTNITVLTNKRTYQIELSSENAEEKDLIYVMRFFYPDEDYVDKGLKSGSGFQNPITPAIPTGLRPFNPSGVSSGNEASIEVASLDLDKVQKNFNYKYSISGPKNLSPKKVFDDGVNTFIKISGKEPKFYEVNEKGFEKSVEHTKIGSFYTLPGVKDKLSLRWNGADNSQVICIFNDGE
ncbi:MAG: TrbG/VirB9 family P-type conjugative transfer protein [Alphaproteobacteria bacterium]|jgi:type IV secretion system protein VirB9